MFDQVREILEKYTEVEITVDSALQANLGLSSFDMVSIVTDFEDVFEIEILDRDIQKFVAVEDIIKYLESRT